MQQTDKPNILIVDDAPANLVLLEHILKSINVNVIKALSGQEALEKLKGKDFALMIFDVLMPEMNGFELAEAVRTEERFQYVPIIFISAIFSDEVSIFKGYQAGAVDYLTKPFKREILLSKVKIFLQLYNQKQEILDKQSQLQANIKKYKEAKDRIARSEEKLQFHIQQTPLAFVETTKNGVIKDWNHSAEQIFGFSKKEVLGKKLNDLIIPEGLSQSESVYNKDNDVNGSSITLKGNMHNRTKEGKQIICEWHTTALKDKDGREIGISSFAQDVTEHILAEKKLKESEALHKSLLNASPEGIILVNLNGVIEKASDRAYQMVGFNSEEELTGLKALDFVSPESIQKVARATLKTRHRYIVSNVECKIERKDKTQYPAEISATLIRNFEGEARAWMIIVRDVSERKELERQLLHTERMAGVGEMAAGIAHEINQPLNTISFSIDNLIEAIKSGMAGEDYITKKSTKIFDSISRMRNIIDHVRAFSREDKEVVKSKFSINESIKNAVSMVSAQYTHHGISIHLDLQEDLFQPLGSTYKYEQVVLNMLSNARDAIEEKIKVVSKPFDTGIYIKTYQSSRHLITEVIDMGIGISPDELNKIMLPFFTTKEVGKGTGLGLSISYSIIKELGGELEYISTKLEKTMARIKIPI